MVEIKLVFISIQTLYAVLFLTLTILFGEQASKLKKLVNHDCLYPLLGAE